jgi:hypothetical protein
MARQRLVNEPDTAAQISLYALSAKGALSGYPGAAPQEFNHPGDQALKARFSSVMVLHPKHSASRN